MPSNFEFIQNNDRQTDDTSERAIVGNKQGTPFLDAGCRVQCVWSPEVQSGAYFGGIFPQSPCSWHQSHFGGIEQFLEVPLEHFVAVA